MEIIGQVADIIYQNEVNSYLIATFETEEGSTITIVGYLPFVQSGDSLKVTGKYVNHIEYGEQFKVETFEKRMPEGSEALQKYLAGGAIKGIGPSIAKKIVETFGEDTISVLKWEPKKLAIIKGITEEKAIAMGEEFTANWDKWQLVGFLDKFGIGPENSKNVYDYLGTDAISQVEQNPYVLVDIIKTVDFKQVDKIAMELGFSHDNSKRIKSGIKYGLNKIAYNGHCTTLLENLFVFTKDLLNVTEEDIENAIIDLKVNNEMVIEERGEEKWVYLMPFYQAEQNIADKLIQLDKASNSNEIKDIEKEVKRIEKKQKIELSEKQKEAVYSVNKHNVCIITGGPGTGKTTIIKTIIDLYKAHGKKPVLCAPTGRAAKRMTEATEEEAKTLHRLLEIGKMDENKRTDMELQVAPISADIIIVDEISMVDLFLMNYLMKAIYTGTKVVLVGDVDQLPSVGPGSILKDLIDSEKLETITLNKIFRQAAKSKIIVNAHRVNEGKGFLKPEEAKDTQNDFFYIKCNSQDRIKDEILSLCKGRLGSYGDFDFFKNIQVISPSKKGMLGTKELNKALQQELNPSKEGEPEKSNSGYSYRKGDRVMQTKNNYDIFWERQQPVHETGSGIFNGELGRIMKIDEENKQVKVQFDDEKVAWYEYSELDQLELAYAITIHKAQRK